MAQSQDIEIELVTDSRGNVDIPFYEAEAMKRRDQYLRKGFLRLLALAKVAVISWFSAPARTRNA